MEKGDILFSTALIQLLQGLVVKGSHPEIWNTLTTHRYRIGEYMEKIGLSLEIDTEGGYAFLKQQDSEELPHLVRKQPLTFKMSLFLALLRNEINEFDGANGDSMLVVKEEEMVQKMKPYFPETSDEVKFINSIKTCFSKAMDMKIVMPVKDNELAFEVQPILRRFVDAEWLSEFNKELQRYVEENGLQVEEKEETAHESI